MSLIYAKIDMTYMPSAVVNIQVINDGDYLDPAFTWVDVTDSDPQPFAWCSYDGTNFSNYLAAPYISEIPSDLPTGTETTITPFTLSPDSHSFDVSIDGALIDIGCQQYDYKWLRYALYMLANKIVPSIGIFTQADTGVDQGNFLIAQVDVNAIYAALCTLV